MKCQNKLVSVGVASRCELLSLRSASATLYDTDDGLVVTRADALMDAPSSRLAFYHGLAYIYVLTHQQINNEQVKLGER